MDTIQTYYVQYKRKWDSLSSFLSNTADSFVFMGIK